MKEAIFDDALKGAYHDIEATPTGEETVDYKQVATLGVCAIVATVVGILGFFWTPFVAASAIGLTLGVLALRKIMRAPEETTGGALAIAAIALSALLFVSSASWRAYSYYCSAPPGYEILPFDSMALTKDGQIPPEILALDGRKVYVDGFMYPTKQHAGIENFTLVRTLGHCQYCSPGTNPADMIAVQMERGHTVKYRANKSVSVGGVLYVDPNWRNTSGSIPYSMKANVFH